MRGVPPLAEAGGPVTGCLPRRAALMLPAAAVLAAPAIARAQGLAVVGREGWLFPLWDRVDRVDAGNLRTVTDMLAQAVGILKQARIETVICLIPSKARIYRRFLPANSRVSPEADRRYALPMAELRRAGALVPDLDAVFRQASARDPHWPVFWKTDTHWTPLGAEAAAVAIAREMREQLRLPPAPGGGTRLGELRPSRLQQGDLVRYVPPAQRGQFGPEESLIRDVVAEAGGGGLLDGDSTDVQVVGTSNVQPRFGFVPVLSNQAMRPVGLSWRPNNIGPYAALMDFVRSAGFRRERPRAIVWNHLEQDMLLLPNNSLWQTAAMTPQAFLADLRRAVA